MSREITRSRLWTAPSLKAPNKPYFHELTFLGTRPRRPNASANRADLRCCVFRRASILLPALVEAARVQSDRLLARDCRRPRFVRRGVIGIDVKQRCNRRDWCCFAASL